MNRSEDGSLPSQPHTIKRGGKRVWIHAFTTKGHYTRLRNGIACVLLVMFYATPWIKVDGLPLLELSFLDSSFVILGRPILIYEIHHFVLLALLLVLSLIVASTLFGRIWCGYACPQTIFIEHVLGRIERLCEGPPARRLANAGKPLTLERIIRKLCKQLAYVLVSFSFAFTLVAIFTGPDLLLSATSKSAWIATALLTALAWFDGGYWREQFCHIVCPYGRLQGVMQDGATRTIGYDTQRGEPRRHGKQRAGAGDCIDCGLCVRVCPSGIDIRQGAHQLECIGCARCIDACDGVMSNVGKPRGLIRYDAVAIFAATRPDTTRPKIWRPRVVFYSLLWSVLLALGIGLFVTRRPFVVKVLSTPGSAPYFVDGDRLKNLFMIKVGNQGREAEAFRLKISAIDGADSEVLRLETPTRLGPIVPGQEAAIAVLASGDHQAAGVQFHIEVRGETSGETQTVTRKLVGPAQR